jgi:hypothetical protein
MKKLHQYKLDHDLLFVGTPHHLRALQRVLVNIAFVGSQWRACCGAVQDSYGGEVLPVAGGTPSLWLHKDCIAPDAMLHLCARLDCR